MSSSDTKDVAGDVAAHLIRVAESGNASAMNALGELYLQGVHATRDIEKAVSWLKRAADAGHSKAPYTLGQCYQKGDGMVIDHTAAVGWFRRAIANGDKSLSRRALAHCYRAGTGVDVDLDQAFQLYIAAAEHGDAPSLRALGVMHETGDGVEPDDLKAAKYYERAATLHDAKAAHSLAALYSMGRGVPLDIAQARALCEIAHANGLPIGSHDLEVCYDTGRRAPRTPKRAFAWYKRLADDDDNAEALVHLGDMYNDGHGVERDLDAAAKCYARAAGLGNCAGMVQLAYCYDTGDGVKRESAMSKLWLQRAIDAGHADAMTLLGMWHIRHRHDASDDEQAKLWLLRGVERGSLEAMFTLAGEYTRAGAGLPQDMGIARVLYFRAATEGHVKSMNAIGWLYMTCPTCADEVPVACKWFRDAAEHNLPEAAVNLAMCYRDGRGVATNAEEADKWMRTAVAGANANQQRHMARACLRGDRGFVADAGAAMWLYRHAAEARDGKAQCIVALQTLYRTKELDATPTVTRVDETAALEWLWRSSANGGEDLPIDKVWHHPRRCCYTPCACRERDLHDGALKICDGCYLAAYCSEACRRVAWRAGHRQHCAAFGAMDWIRHVVQHV